MNTITKRLLSMLVVMAMVLSMSPVITLPAAAATNPVKERVDAWVAENTGKEFTSTYCPFCDATVEWKAFDSTTAYDAFSLKGQQHVYLAENITSTSAEALRTYWGSVENSSLCLYLNDKTFTFDGYIYTRSAFTVMGNGTVTRTAVDSTNPMFVNTGDQQYENAINIFGGTWTNNSSKAIFAPAWSKVGNIYGGTFTTDAPFFAPNDASSFVLNIYGGTINGGSNTVIDFSAKGGTFNMYGGTINAGAGARAFYLTKSDCNVTIAGGTINGAQFTGDGGTVRMELGTITMSGGTIQNGNATGWGGNVYMSGGTFNMTGGEIKNGTSSANRGGNVAVYNSVFNMSGGTLSGGSSVSGGGNLFMRNDGARVTISGTAVIKEGKGAGKGDNVFVERWNSAPTLNMTGGTICDGESDNVYVEGASLVMTGGKIIAKENGSAGNALMVCRTSANGASLTLGGTAEVTTRSETPANALRINGYIDNSTPLDTMHIEEDFSGTVYVYLSNALKAGDTIAPENVTFDSGFTGKLYAHGCEVVEDNGALKLVEIQSAPTEEEIYGAIDDVKERVDTWVANNSGAAFNSGYCPFCKATVEWKAFDSTTAYDAFSLKGQQHVYLAENITSTSAEALRTYWGSVENSSLCLYLNDKTFTFDGYIYTRSAFTVMGNGTVTRTAVDSTNPMFVNTNDQQYENAINIFGGTWTNNSSKAIFAPAWSKVGNIYGGTFTTAAPFFAPDDASSFVLNINGGTINGGNNTVIDITTKGGTVNINGGTLNGKILMNNASATVKLAGGTINGIDVGGGDGGAVELWAGSFTMNGGTITGGKAGRGGNVFVAGGTFNMSGGTISEGEATSLGGNVYLRNVTFAMSGDAEIKDGKGTGTGDNVFVEVWNTSGKLTMTDNAKIYGGETDNVYLKASTMEMSGNATVIADAGEEGNAIYVSRNYDYHPTTNAPGTKSSLTLSGNASVVAENGVNENAILVYGYTGDNAKDSLHIAAGWNGTAYVEFHNCRLSCGDTVSADNGTCDAAGFTGDLYIRGIKGYGVDGALVFASALKLVTSAGEEWFLTAEEALTAYEAAEGAKYLKMADSGEFEIDCDITLDVAGRTATVNGAGKVYLLDSANDDYEGYGYIKPAAGVEVQTEASANGNRYVAIADEKNEEGGYYSAHRIEIKLTKVTLRPGRDGLYYKAAYTCDDKLASRVSTYGVIVNADHAPGEADMQPGVFSALTGLAEAMDAETHTAAGTSASVWGILKEGKNNAERVDIKIYANAYFAVDVAGTADESDDVIVLGDASKAYSMMDIMQYINNNWAAYAEKADVIKAFMDKWDAELGWSSVLTNIA